MNFKMKKIDLIMKMFEINFKNIKTHEISNKTIKEKVLVCECEF